MPTVTMSSASIISLPVTRAICVPNAGFYIETHVERRYFRGRGNEGYKPAIVDTGSFLDRVNLIAYMDGHHHYMFDKKNLINTIKKAPFSYVSLREFDSKIDDESCDIESIYASAIRKTKI